MSVFSSLIRDKNQDIDTIKTRSIERFGLIEKKLIPTEDN